MDNQKIEVMEPEKAPEEVNGEEYRDCDTTEAQKTSEGLTLKKVVLVVGGVVCATWVVKTVAPYARKWLKGKAEAYVEYCNRIEAETAEEVVCEPYGEVNN